MRRAASEYEIRNRNDGEKTTATRVLESAQPRKTVSCDNRQRRKRGQDVAAELGAGNREEHEDDDEPDGEEASRRSVAPEGAAESAKSASARIADHPSGTKKIHGHIPPITIGMKNHGPHPCSLDET